MAVANCHCSCTQSPLALCSFCVLSHISTPGSHILQSYTSLPPDSCQCCLRDTAEVVCCCEAAGVTLCGNCISQHSIASLGKVHIVLPLKAREYVGRTGYLEKLRKRQMSLERGIQEIANNIDSISVCKQRVNERVDAYITIVSQYRDNTLTELDCYKELLEEALRIVKTEVETHIYEESYVPSNGLVEAVWTSALPQLGLFKFSNKGQYQVEIVRKLNADMSLALKEIAAKPASPYPELTRTPPVQVEVKLSRRARKKAEADLCTSITPTTQVEAPIKLSRAARRRQREALSTPFTPTMSETASPCSPFDLSSTLVEARGGYAYVYNCLTQSSIKAAKLPTQVSALSSMVFLPTGSLLLLGKETPLSATAIELDLVTGEHMIHPDMIDKRYGHGVLRVGYTVYVFGGSDAQGRLKVCEAFELQRKCWRRVADMTTARDLFNPCLYAGFAYIFAGRKTRLCEKYSIPFDAFIPLQVKAPISGQCCAVIVSDSIIIVQRKHVARWRLEDEVLESASEESVENCWGPMAPIAISDTVFIVNANQGKVLQVKIPTAA